MELWMLATTAADANDAVRVYVCENVFPIAEQASSTNKTTQMLQISVG